KRKTGLLCLIAINASGTFSHPAIRAAPFSKRCIKPKFARQICRGIRQNALKYCFQINGRTRDQVQNFRGRALPLQRLITLARASRKLRFLGRTGGTAPIQFWRGAALWHLRLAAARLNFFAASSEAPCHGLPQARDPPKLCCDYIRDLRPAK